MKVTIEYFGGHEIELIYLVASVNEAERVEKVLDASPFKYAVDLVNFVGTISVMTAGLGFYVSPPFAEQCRAMLSDNGLSAGMVLR